MEGGTYPPSVLEKLNDYDKLFDGCWQYRGRLSKKGYAISGKYYLHRVSYETNVRHIMEGLVIDHACKNRACINPKHLRQVSNAQNVLSNSNSLTAINKNKTHCFRGHEFSKENTRNRQGKRYCLACEAIRRADACSSNE